MKLLYRILLVGFTLFHSSWNNALAQSKEFCYEFFEEKNELASNIPFMYEWDFGDGHTARALKATHCYQKPGVYNVVLSVIDSITNEVQESVAEYQLVVKGRSAKEYNDRGVKLERDKKYGKALDSYNIALSMKPDFALAYFNRGLTYAKLNRFKESISDHTRAIELNPSLHNAFHHRGKMYLMLNQRDLACADFRKTHELGYSVSDENIKEYCQE